MRPTILITGGSGLLALNWALAARAHCSIVLGLHTRAVSVHGVATRRINLESESDLARVLEEVRPSAVIHTAGMTNIEACESNPELARHTNVELSVNVARACARLGVAVAHISTDHLFSGDIAGLTETDPVSPKNVYARTKAEAESRVLDANPEALVVRTNFYGWGPRYRQSFTDVILMALRARNVVTLFQDVHYTPILIEVLVDVVHALLDRKANGIFHVVSDERISKYRFGLKLAETFQLDPSVITAGNLSEHRTLVQRPRDMSLSNQKACRLLGRKLGAVDEQLQKLLQQEKLGLAREVQSL